MLSRLAIGLDAFQVFVPHSGLFVGTRWYGLKEAVKRPFEMRIQAAVARMAKRDEIIFVSEATLAVWADMMNMKFNVHMVFGTTTTYSASV